jgi:hypothetical protein
MEIFSLPTTLAIDRTNDLSSTHNSDTEVTSTIDGEETDLVEFGNDLN